MVAVNGRRIAVGPAVSRVRWLRCVCGHARNRTQLLADQARKANTRSSLISNHSSSSLYRFSILIATSFLYYMWENVLQVVGAKVSGHEKPGVEAKRAY